MSQLPLLEQLELLASNATGAFQGTFLAGSNQPFHLLGPRSHPDAMCMHDHAAGAGSVLEADGKKRAALLVLSTSTSPLVKILSW